MSEEIKKDKPDKVYLLKSGKIIFWIIIFFVSLELLLVLCDVLFAYRKMIPFEEVITKFDLTSEEGTGTIFATLQTCCSAFILWIIYFVFHKSGNSKNAGYWWIMAAFFTYMAFDDALSLHEGSGYFIKYMSSSFLKGESGELLRHISQGFPSYPWQLLMGPFFALMGFFIFYFLFNTLRGMKLRRYVFIGLTLFAVAMAMDFVEGLSVPYPIIFIKNMTDLENFTVHHYWMVVEELFEMIGNTFFLFVFLKYLASILKGQRISIE